jgi:hypothetical protein
MTKPFKRENKMNDISDELNEDLDVYQKYLLKYPDRITTREKILNVLQLGYLTIYERKRLMTYCKTIIR